MLVLALAAVAASGALGAALAKFGRDGDSSLIWLLIPCLLDTATWVWVLKHPLGTVTQAALSWWVVHCVAYMATLAVLGEPFTAARIAGATMALAGLWIAR